MLKIFATIAFALLVSTGAFKDIGSSVMGSIKSPAEVGQMIKGFSNKDPEQVAARRDEAKRKQQERIAQRQEAEAKRYQDHKDQLAAKQQQQYAARQQVAPQQVIRTQTVDTVTTGNRTVVRTEKQVADKSFAKIRDIGDDSPAAPVQLAMAPTIRCGHNIGGTIDMSGNLTCNH